MTDTQPTENSRDVGVGTSPDGRIAVAIDGKGHIIDTDDAEWIAERIRDICDVEKPVEYERTVEDMCLQIVGISERSADELRSHDIEDTADVREAGFRGLTAVDGIGEHGASQLLEKAYEEVEP